MGRTAFPAEEIPHFSYDRAWTNATIRSRLADPGSPLWLETAAWIMREAAFRDVWSFLSPAEVNRYLEELAPRLGKHQGFWRYIIGAWRELGKIAGPDAA